MFLYEFPEYLPQVKGYIHYDPVNKRFGELHAKEHAQGQWLQCL